MARLTTPLTAKEIQSAKPREKEYKLFDGGGLYLAVTPKGGKWWRLKYRFDNKEKRLALGVYPDLSLQEARKLREAYKAQIAEGINPNDKKKQKKEAEAIEELESLNTFEKLARERLTLVKDEISEAHYNRTLNALINDCFPIIGKMPINEVEAKHILEILHIMVDRNIKESARKLFFAISKTFKWAVANGKARRNPASDILLEEVIGKKSTKHYPTITDDMGIRGLLLAIDSYTGEHTTKRALQMLAHVFVRPYNIRHAEWSEIDFKNKQWRISSEKMKTSEDLIVPLTDTVIEILQDVRRYTGEGQYVFHSPRGKTSPMSENTLLGAIRRLGYTKEEFVPHGFRAMFSTIAHEKSNFKHEIIETQLAHSVGNAVSQAYNRAKYLDERIELMQWWSNYLNKLQK